MNLLKLLTLVVFTASISLLLPTSAQAVDHPWDDRPTDTTTVGYKPQNGSTDGPKPNTPIITRIIEWTRLFFLEVRSVFLGNSVKSDLTANPPQGSDKRIMYPVGTRRNK